MGKRDTIAFKLQVLQPILKGKMTIREAAHFYNIPSLYLILDLFNYDIALVIPQTGHLWRRC